MTKCIHCDATVLSSSRHAPSIDGEVLNLIPRLLERADSYINENGRDDAYSCNLINDLASILRRVAARAQRAPALDALKAYEQWEADLIMENKCWEGREVPQLTGELWDRLLELRAMRNRALYALSSTDGCHK